MREVDLELDFCPKCEPEETQDPFPAQEHCFFNSFATVVQCTKCGTRYVPSPKSGVIITLNCCLWFWVSFYLSNSWHSPLQFPIVHFLYTIRILSIMQNYTCYLIFDYCSDLYRFFCITFIPTPVLLYALQSQYTYIFRSNFYVICIIFFASNVLWK